MTTSSRTTIAIHILTLLAFCGPEPLTSEFIAGSVNTNPVVIRRLLARLREAGLVGSQGGPGGGWQLLRAPGKVTLRDIHRAVEGGSLFALHTAGPNPQCPVGRTIQSALEGIYAAAQAALEAELGRTTLAHLVKDVKTRAS
ncbi:Rrf2 family transcriptional regulator [Mesoterricola silvestris]|uniref:Rrf2 family transcriptional regulator n=1 Tax=Mesoterricola silvestris TaxID=2927979 RepID=A0AA48KCK3_9BACT|nr:Rrf2 family transcriptional regulator [Mesoterricola silvestris]BDU73598.1 Rrf2 family transcriptional regulator [Mesoterricola silvestris]